MSATLTDSKISVAQLLGFVNKYLPDILPMDVAKNFDRNARAKGQLRGGAMYSESDSDTSIREVLSEALLETAQNDEERALIQKYQEESDGLYEFDTLKKRYEDENNGVTRTRVTYH